MTPAPRTILFVSIADLCELRRSPLRVVALIGLIAAIVLTAPPTSRAFTPALGNWDGVFRGQPISWQLVRHGQRLLVRDFVNGAPACTPPGAPTRYGLNVLPSFGTVTHNVFGSPPLTLLGVRHPASRSGYGGRFLSRTQAVFGAVGPARHSAACSVPAVRQTFRVRAGARHPVSDGSWIGTFTPGGDVASGATFRLKTSSGGRLIYDYSATIPAVCSDATGGISFSHGQVFVHRDGTFRDSYATFSGEIVVAGRFGSSRSAAGTFSAPGPPGAGCPSLSGSWTLRRG